MMHKEKSERSGGSVKILKIVRNTLDFENILNNTLNGKELVTFTINCDLSLFSGQQSAVFDLFWKEQQETGVKVCRGLTFGGRIKRNLVCTIDRQNGNSSMRLVKDNETLTG